MDFKELKYIIEIWKHGSISRAAEELGISQPSLSKFLQNVEKKYKVTLFNRKGKLLTLTFAGERYVNIAEKILQTSKSIESDQLSDEITEIEKLIITYPPEIEEFLFTDILLPFRKRYPNILLENKTNTNNLERLLLAGDIDIAITNKIINNKKIYQEKIWDEEIKLVTTAISLREGRVAFRDGLKEPLIDIKYIENMPIILVSSSEQAKIKVEELIKNENIKPAMFMQTSNTSASVRAVASGFGACLVPQINIKYFRTIESIMFFSLENLHLRLETYFTCRKSASNATLYIRKLLKEYVDAFKK